MDRRTFLAGCGFAATLQAIADDVPTGSNSRAYSLAASPEGRAYLSWIETEPGDRPFHTLQFSRLDDDLWTRPKTIARGGAGWFVDALDHPAIAAGPDGRLMASWRFRPEAARGEKYGYGCRFAFSPDGGETWRIVHEPGADNVTDSTGFVALDADETGFRAAYLAPEATGGAQRDAPHVKTLRFAEFDLDGELIVAERVDGDVCTCCPLDVTRTAAGPAIVYRDHQADEIRDVSIVVRTGGRWSEPRPVRRDGWEIASCPGAGAAIDSAGGLTSIAWFTAADEWPRVWWAASRDGTTFPSPEPVDLGAPAGQAGVAVLPDGRSVITWLEKQEGQPGVGDLLMRVAYADGRLGSPRPIATTTSGRGAGVPQVVAAGNRVVVAWREDEKVRARTLALDG